MHWVFVVKYWSIACKIELIMKHENADRLNPRFVTLYAGGILLNTVSGVLFAFLGNPLNK